MEILGLDVSEPLDEKTRNEILAEFYEHVALLFRGQNMTVEQQNRFTTTFGDIGKRTVGPRLRKSADDIYTTPIMVVSNIRENGKPLEGASANGDAEMGFHQDTAFHEVPDAVTILYGIEVSAHGGHTMVTNQCKAYDNVPGDLKEKLEGCRVLQVYDYQRHTVDADIDLSGARYYAQPIFIAHPVTGRKALYVNRMMSVRIEGMDQGGERRHTPYAVRHRRRPELHVRAHVGGGRPADVGQLLLDPRPHVLPRERAPAAAAHHRRRHGPTARVRGALCPSSAAPVPGGAAARGRAGLKPAPTFLIGPRRVPCPWISEGGWQPAP